MPKKLKNNSLKKLNFQIILNIFLQINKFKRALENQSYNFINFKF